MDVILTGIARSGTTLACSLLNRLPQAVALHEPMNPAALAGLEYPAAYLDRIAAFFAAQRESLCTRGVAVSKARDGVVPDNPFGESAGASGLRPSTVSGQAVRIGKRLEPGFRLVVKHPNMFTATLPALRSRFPCFALVRNPLAVLLSWHSIQAPVNEGRLPFGEAFDPSLREALASEPDRVARQLAILGWYYSRYAAFLPPQNVIRYEDLVSSGGRALRVIDPDADALDEPLGSRNATGPYDAALVGSLAARLLDAEPIYGGFYSRSDVDGLRKAWTGA